MAVTADEIDNGLYVTKLRSGTVEGPVSVSAVWVSSPNTPLPRETVTINMVTADSMQLEVDDPVVLADGQDEATIIAYLLDGLGRPVNNADVSFRLVDGAGQLIPQVLQGRNGRYAATFRPTTTPGDVVIEASLPTNTQLLREQVDIKVVESTSMNAIAFPERVARRLPNQAADSTHTSTILVPVRDGDGDLVRGLTNSELVAQVISGPGRVIGPVEILLGGQNRTGVYKFTFISEETTGTSVVRILNVESPRQASADVTIETVTQVNPTRVESVEILNFADEPFYADGASQALLVMLAADRSGNAVTGLGDEVDVVITNGQGFLGDIGTETPNLAGAFGTGIYLAAYTAGTSGRETSTQIRATFLNADGTLEEQNTELTLTPLGSPKIVVFPARVPASRAVMVTVDIFDFDTRGLDDLNVTGLAAANANTRYRVDLIGGPGRISQALINDGANFDLVADDNVSTAVVEIISASGGEQQTDLTVIDLAAAGYPSTQASFELGRTTNIRVMPQPTLLDQGETLEVIAFAQDEFGLPAIGHDLRITVVSGSAQVAEGGRMLDNGLEMAGFMDPFADDGMYVGAFRATGTSGDTITVKIVDLTPPNQPEFTLEIEVRE